MRGGRGEGERRGEEKSRGLTGGTNKEVGEREGGKERKRESEREGTNMQTCKHSRGVILEGGDGFGKEGAGPGQKRREDAHHLKVFVPL